MNNKLKEVLAIMHIGVKIKRLREERGLTQEYFAEKICVTRQAVSKWENENGYPDIENIINISNAFDVSLDELIKGNKNVEEKLIVDNASKKWHILVIGFLVSIIAYIVYFALVHEIFMLGFGIATLFMLGIELRIYFRKHIKRKVAKYAE